MGCAGEDIIGGSHGPGAAHADSPWTRNALRPQAAGGIVRNWAAAAGQLNHEFLKHCIFVTLMRYYTYRIYYRAGEAMKFGRIAVDTPDGEQIRLVAAE